jgi:hypothetical protein
MVRVVAVADQGLEGAFMNLTIANVSTTIDDQSFATTVDAISTQIARDFSPLWGVTAAVSGTRLNLAGGQASVNAPADAIIYVGESSADPTTGVSGVFGYHSDNYSHIPYGFVYLDVCQQYAEPWSCTLSHEVLELLADPTAALTVAGPAPAGSTDSSVYYDLEVCDPTQSDQYAINGVTVSNFVTKAYFGIVGGPTSNTNFLNLALAPFAVRPKGYVQYEDAAGVNQINGSKVDAKRLAARNILGKHRRNARRAARIRRAEKRDH